MYAPARVGSKALKELSTVILTARPASLTAAAAPLPALTFRIILHARILTRLFLCTHLLARKLRILFLTQGFKVLLDIDLVLHIALNVSRFI